MLNKLIQRRKLIYLLYTLLHFFVHHDRKSFEFEDLKRSTSPLFSRLPEHHYEDIPGQKPLISISDLTFLNT